VRGLLDFFRDFRVRPEVGKISMWVGISLGALLLIAFIVLSVMAGSPKDAVYMVRYALPHMHRGNLKVGDAAPDAKLFALNGTDTFHMRERASGKPLVLVFGSFT
jgi:hypothetical protein